MLESTRGCFRAIVTKLARLERDELLGMEEVTGITTFPLSYPVLAHVSVPTKCVSSKKCINEWLVTRMTESARIV
jgi:hypothetical protein